MPDPQPPPEPQRDEPAADARKADFAQTARAVGWSFLGIRRSSGLERDAKLNPLHVVIAAIVGVALFVVFLVLLVHWVTHSGVAR
jgi:hypothetical protein